MLSLLSAWFLSPVASPEAGRLPVLLFTAAGLAAAFFAAFRLRRLPRKKGIRLLFSLGLLLAGLETAKFFFRVEIADGYFNVWYFPFQLCSLPIYLCCALPFLSEKKQTTVCTFLMTYSLLGGLMALTAPYGLLHPWLLLTLHGFLWHFILVFLGLFCAASGLGSFQSQSFRKATGLFCISAALAEALNVLLHPLGDADLFYISPYHDSTQPFFCELDKVIGRGPEILLYLALIVYGAWCVRRWQKLWIK